MTAMGYTAAELAYLHGSPVGKPPAQKPADKLYEITVPRKHGQKLTNALFATALNFTFSLTKEVAIASFEANDYHIGKVRAALRKSRINANVSTWE